MKLTKTQQTVLALMASGKRLLYMPYRGGRFNENPYWFWSDMSSTIRHPRIDTVEKLLGAGLLKWTGRRDSFWHRDELRISVKGKAVAEANHE